MQFYIININPVANAEMLPDYCLKKVNIREGWQMISDIGHLFGVTWEGQNKDYNPYHAETRQYWKHEDDLNYFVEHYISCLMEYEARFDKRSVFHDKFLEFVILAKHESIANQIGIQRSKYDSDNWQTIKYLVEQKTKHLTSDEIKALNNEESI